MLKKLYLDNFNAVHGGTVFDIYSDAAYLSPVTGSYLTPGTYYIVATNPDCSDDSSTFTVNVKNKDFDIVWQSAPAIGKGYYTFTAPAYSGATYAWFAWGGSMISGNTTNQLTVYYSETAAPSVLVTCTITLPSATARTTIDGGFLQSGTYITGNGSGDKVEITPGITTAVVPNTAKNALIAYPNPATESFVLSGSGVYDVKMYNTLGQLVYTNSSYKAETPISVSTKGMHVAYITQNGISQVVKIVVE